MPLTKPLLWFPLSIATAVIAASLHLLSKRSELSIEFLFSLTLIVAGFEASLHVGWLQLAYFPFIIVASAFYSLQIIIPFSILVPLLHLRAFFSQETFADSVMFAVFFILTAAVSSLLFRRLRDQSRQAVSDLEKIRSSAREVAPGSDMQSLDSEEVISHYVATALEADQEIQEILQTMQQALLADAAHLFVPSDDSFTLRCSAGENLDMRITGRGVLASSQRDKKTFFSGDLDEKATEVGYIKHTKVSSLIVSPILDGPSSIGLLALDSSRYQAFTETDRNSVEMFAKQFVRIFERERVSMLIKRDISGMKILKEGSANLVTSLDIGLIAEKLSGAAERVVNSHICIFLRNDQDFELVHHTGVFHGEQRRFQFKGTIVQIAVENKQRYYIGDTTEYRIPLMPFETRNISAVIAVPLLYESELLGVFIMLSKKRNFLDSFQLGLLEVLCSQASIAIANAQLHAEIEKLATIDGLTGLYNHRRFQEKLADEFKRLNRSPARLSLVLADIDYFKKVNDSYGHPAGDLVLKGVSHIIREEVREMDVPARYGGEEFAVLLPGTDADGAGNIAERLRKAVMDAAFEADGRSLSVTISIGIATAPDDAQHAQELIEKADRALYQAKHSGRNRSVLWRSIP